MADADNSAEKAYAAAAAEASPSDKAPESKATEPETAATKPAEAKESKVTPIAETAPAKAPKAAPVKKSAVAKKPVASKKTTVKTAPKKPAPSAPRPVAAKPAKAPVANPAPQRTVTELKERIMATAKTDMTATMTEAMKEMQTKAKAAYEKSTEMATEAADLAKGNVEALVESGKIFSSGIQDMSKSYVDEAKSAYETLTADMKEMAGVKSPTELFQLQGKIMRRNFDAFVATSSKSSEAMMKLANDAFAPLSGRMTIAAEKFSKVA